MGERKSKEEQEKLNRLIGKRLRQCRKEAGLTQPELAEKAYFSSYNSISWWETGKRKLSWENAILLGGILKVNPAYIMYESDIKNPNLHHHVLDVNTFGISDNYFIHFLIASGHSIIFHVCELYADGQPEHKIQIEQFAEFSLSDYKCKILADNIQKPLEGIIMAVSVDDLKMSFGSFCFAINRMYDYIHFTFENMKKFIFDFDIQQGGNHAAHIALKEAYSNNDKNAAFSNMIDAIKAEYGEEAISSIGEDLDIKP